MAGTTMAALKSALKTAIDAEGSIDVPVAYGHPGDLGRKEHIWLGGSQLGDSEASGFRSGRKRRQESYTLEVVIEVMNDPTPEATETRAVALATVIEEMLADDPKVNNTTNLLWCALESLEMDTTETGEGPRTLLTLTLRAEARLL